ncbi:MAG: hypothetical protein K1X94_20380 [Sandaracinaceae bacterium]|jgi:hypothetical protein|nr:hypothetical protein [Sandaracinaceae bacterium]
MKAVELRVGEGRSTLEARDGYLLVTELADVRTPEDMRRWLGEIDRFASARNLERVVFDARHDSSEPMPGVREARWEHSDRAPVLKIIAVVLPNELASARVNMTVLARKTAARLRAFATIEDAAAWALSVQPRR